MPADEYFESTVEPEQSSGPAQPAVSADAPASVDPWGEVPIDERLDWARALHDFPPVFPGPTVMFFIQKRIRSGRVASLDDWAWQAAAFHRIGFTAADWYLLRLCVEQRLERLLARGDGRFVVDTQRLEFQSVALVAEHWTDWLPMTRSGVTPLRALDEIIERGPDGCAWPGGFVIDVRGGIIGA
ncbi:hypothetical protein GCM10009819_20490 [Agromyces tropicus]|uniref:Uncharacterized protein n=1 Tax=Agromyces tropicus TaxID=555371 RepID=A0ABN2UFF0_9MICO